MAKHSFKFFEDQNHKSLVFVFELCDTSLKNNWTLSTCIFLVNLLIYSTIKLKKYIM